MLSAFIVLIGMGGLCFAPTERSNVDENVNQCK